MFISKYFLIIIIFFKIKNLKLYFINRPKLEDLKKALPKGADIEKIEKDRVK